MKRVILAASILVMAAIALWSQPKVAVLDAIIPQNMDPSVVVPVTEKIVERLVVSGRFTVLDRANIESVLKEREFQVSGMVSDQDVVTAGKYLGADFVVVAKVQKVGDTYFISAKMIAIKTGVIANQTSAQGEGKLSELISLAEQVGEILSGGAVLAQSAAGGQSDISKPARPQKIRQTQAIQPQNSKRAITLGLSYVPTTWKETYSMTSDGVFTTQLDYFSLDIGFETRYLMANLAFGSQTSGYSRDDYDGVTGTENEITDSLTYLGIGGFAKFPFQLGSIMVFPFLGAEYFLNTSIKDSTGTDISGSLSPWGNSIYLDRLFIEAGVGTDFAISPKLFARGQFTFGYKVPTTADSDYIDYNISYYFPSYVSGSVATILLRAGVAVGYRF